jgi:hypothetical protein
VNIDVSTVATTVASVLLVAQMGWLWRLSRLARSLERHEHRLSQMSEAMGLLTEATESGFRAVASEVERIAESGRVRPVKPVSVARMAAAAGRGRSLAEIAATEGVSEGEVALRLHLSTPPPRQRAQQGRSRSRKTMEPTDGTVRVE